MVVHRELAEQSLENHKVVDFCAAAEAMLQAGLSAFPARRADKFPTGLKWGEFQQRRMTPAEVPQFFRLSDAICVICGPVSGGLTILDFDDAGSRFESWQAKVEAVNPQLFASLVIERSPSGGYHVGARSDLVIGNEKLAMSADGKTTLIETRGKGGLVVVDPTPGYQLEQNDLIGIPTITSGQMEFLLDCARSFDERAPATEKPKPTATTASAPRAAGPADESTPWGDFNIRGDFRAILERHGWRKVRDAIPGDDNERWRRPGKGEKGHSATVNGDRLFYVWSSNSEPFRNGKAYNPFQVYAMLEHGGDFTAAGAALGELGYGKQDHGADTSAILAIAEVAPHGNDDDYDAADESKDPGPFPRDCLRPPGLISDIIDYNLRTAIYPQPVLALAGALAVMGVITGRKIRLRRDTRTNLMLLVLAPTGIGKDQARNVAKRVLISAACADMVGQDRITSHAGIISQLASSQSSLIQPDEFQSTIDSACHGKNSPHLKHIPEILKEAYSAAVSPMWKPSGYGDRKFNVEIDQPHLVLHATGVGDEFWEACSKELVTGGVIGRMILFEVPSDYSKPVDVSVDDPPPSITAKVAWWRDFAGDGNLFSMHPKPVVVEETADAKDRLMGHMETIRKRQTDETSLRSALWARSGQKTGQLALTLAASRATERKEIVVERQDVDLAIKINNWSTRKLAWHCETHMADSQYAKTVNRVLESITTRGVTRKEWTRKTYRIAERNVREKILRDAVDSGIVSETEIKTTGRPKIVYKRAVAEALVSREPRFGNLVSVGGSNSKSAS